MSEQWALSALHKKEYGSSYNKRMPKPDRCCESVRDSGRWPSYHQCERKRGYGPEQAYCKQHDPANVAAREAANNAKYNKELERRRIEWAAHKLFAALCKIADGDNDPRATALEAIKDLKRPSPYLATAQTPAISPSPSPSPMPNSENETH